MKVIKAHIEGDPGRYEASLLFEDGSGDSSEFDMFQEAAVWVATRSGEIESGDGQDSADQTEES